MLRILRIIADTLADILLFMLLLLSLCGLLCFVRERISGEFAFMFGFRPVYITSGSMEPALPAGSIVIVEKTEGEEPSAGDILLFKTAGGLVVHRLVGKDRLAEKRGERACLITKGDANEVEDERRLDPSDIMGRVTAVFDAAYRRF